MNETIALTKYACVRYRIFLWILIPVLLLSATLTSVSWIEQSSPRLFVIATGCAYLSVMFALMGSVALFGFSRESSLNDPASGFDSWLLRLPISTWKLAIIPAGLITAWIATIWSCTALVVRLHGAPTLPIVSQSLGMSTCAIIACSLVWMPFRAAWMRLAMMIVAFPLLYFVGMGAVIVFLSPLHDWMDWAVSGIVICYVASLALAITSVKLARVATHRIKAAQAMVANQSATTADSRTFTGWQDALTWYDSQRSSATKRWQVMAMSPVMAILIWILPLSAATAICTMIIVGLIAGGVVLARVEPTVWGANSSLPSYLIASPIPSREIASVRLRACMREYVTIMFIMTLLSLLCFVWPSNRETAWRWWTSLTETSASMFVALRMIAAIYVALLMLMLGGSLRWMVVLSRGRQTILLWLAATFCAALLSLMISVLVWFIKQRDWGLVSRVAQDWLLWSYQLFYLAIVMKLIFNAVIVWIASRRIFLWHEIASVIARWCALVIAFALAWYALWPLGGVEFVTVLMTTSLAIPLSVCFTGALAVQANRHVGRFASEL